MAFFKCKKCKKIWHYPIDKCPECFSELERIKSKKAKVIEVLENKIPSLSHPNVPYFILLLEDENGNKWIQKSNRKYKIGEEFKIEVAENKNGVCIWRVKYDFFEVLERMFEIFRVKLEKGSKVLILPTLEKASHPYLRDNTSPEFLESALKFLLELGIKPENIKVASQSFDEIDISQKAIKSGLFEICQKYKVLTLDIEKGSFIKKEDLEIFEEVFKADFILNLPILKIGRAQASQNLFFILKKENFLAQKSLYSEKEIFKKLEKELPETFTIAEGDYIQNENGFINYLNLILASFNPRNLDRVFFEITKKSLPEILSDIKIEEIKILGRKIEEI